jgi:hypothetical protein
MDARRALRTRSQQREDRIDDVTIPEWAVAFAAVGAERDGAQVGGSEKLLERLANATIVIYDRYDTVSRGH